MVTQCSICNTKDGPLYRVEVMTEVQKKESWPLYNKTKFNCINCTIALLIVARDKGALI